MQPRRGGQQIRIAATPDLVWAAITEEPGAWLGGTVELELRAGGRARFRLPGADIEPGVPGPDEHRLGEVAAVEPGHRLAWRWWNVGLPRSSATEVELVLVADGDGTVVTAVESGPGPEPVLVAGA